MKKIYLIDGNSFIYRMFFALPEFSTKDGKIVNAIFGMAKFFVSTLVKEKPDYLIFIKDAKGENFRHQLYADYKATRDKMPDNLRTQIDDIENMISMMKIDIVEIPGYEADDVLATLATKLGKEKENEIFILSGDKDLFSLISENIFVYDTMKKVIFDREKTFEKFGVYPEKIIDYLAICGDKADNIPGIEGFGPKKAVDLLTYFSSVEEILEIATKIENGEKNVSDLEKTVQSCFKGKTFERLLNSKEDAILSKKLATIEKNVDLENFDLENFKFAPKNFKNDEVIEFFKELEFNSLLDDGEITNSYKSWKDLNLKVKLITNLTKLSELAEKIKNSEKIVLDTETTSLDVFEAELVGISIYLDDQNIYYINRLHEGDKVSDADLKDFLKNILELDILIVGHNLKYDLEILENFLEKGPSKQQEEELIQTFLDF